jgi:uncharacterized repeat protein (TIGR02543 family)
MLYTKNRVIERYTFMLNKNRTHVVFFFLFIMFFLFVSCQNSLFNTIDKRTTNLRVSVNVPGRTVLPTSFSDALYELKGITGNTTTTWNYNSLTALEAAELELEEGVWNFTLTVIKNDTTIATAVLKNVTIGDGTVSVLSFSFDESILNYSSGTGVVHVVLQFPSSEKVAVVTAGLYTYSDISVLADSQLSTPTIITGTEYDSVTYENISIGAGDYYLVFKLYQDSNRSICTATYRELVSVANGCVSSATRIVTTLNTEYTITYHLNGISFVTSYTAPATYTSSQNITLPTAVDFDQSSLAFTGWYTSEDFSGTSITAWTATGRTGDIDLYARNTATVTFELNGHGTSIADKTVIYNGTVTKPADPTAGSYYFIGWYSDSACSTAWNFTQAVTSNITLYAKWIDSSEYDSYYSWSYPVSTPKTTWTGMGTESAPYVITTAQQLADLSYLVNVNHNEYKDYYFKLGADIDLNIGYTVNGQNSSYNQWTPIGLGEGNYDYFAGVFDGNGHTIKGLYINSSDLKYAGLFGMFDYGTIKNLAVVSGYICNTYSDSMSCSGGIVGNTGYITSYPSVYATIENCYTNIIIKNINNKYSSIAGGIAGILYYSSAYNCYSMSVITAESTDYVTYTGAITGDAATNGTVAYSYWMTNCGPSEAAYNYNGTIKSVGSFDSSSNSIVASDNTTLLYTGILQKVLNSWVSAQSTDTSLCFWTAGSDGYPECISNDTVYSIIYELNGGSNNTVNPATRTIREEVTLADPTKEGFSFDGWYSDSSLTTKVTAIAADTMKNVTVYAKWLKTVTVTIENTSDTDINLQSSVTGDGTSVTITAASGYDKYEWIVDDTLLAAETNSVTLTSLSAGFHVVTVTVTDSSGNMYSATCYIQKTE